MPKGWGPVHDDASMFSSGTSDEFCIGVSKITSQHNDITANVELQQLRLKWVKMKKKHINGLKLFISKPLMCPTDGCHKALRLYYAGEFFLKSFL
jgi:hypothetical protein